ncbi:Testis intracellular mediator protein [Zea mays]|uniref:rRNA biogenesis protein RRP36 n=1 Tax=Zea mays TaxID=4577 RepID=A0A1D6DXM2_MAIZE|nr:Testis intracellular mediator protein [Zea mays]
MNFFRIPLNLFVCVVLYIVNAFPITVMFGMCSIFLFMAAILLHMQGRNLLIDMFLYYHNYLARAVAQPWCSTSERTHFSVARLPGTPCVEEFTPKNCEMLCNNTKLDLATVETDVDEKVEDKEASLLNTTNQACGLYNEAERLQKMIKKSKDQDAIGEMKSRVTWIDKQLKSHPPKNVESEILREHIKKEREAAKAGKRPYYLRKPELRERKLMNKYNELKVKSTRFTGSFF